MKFFRSALLSFMVPAFASVLAACASGSAWGPHNSLALQEIAPLPRTVVVKPVVEYEPVYNVLKIIEVSEVNGVQKNFLTKIGADRTGITVGVAGEISEDAEFTKIIGTYRISEVYGGFFKSQIDTLTYKIGPVAFVRIKIGEKEKGVK